MEVLMLSISITASFESCVIFSNVAHVNGARMYIQIIWKCIETCYILYMVEIEIQFTLICSRYNEITCKSIGLQVHTNLDAKHMHMLYMYGTYLFK